MKKYSYLIIIVLISSLVLVGCSLLSNVGQVPSSEQSGIAYLTKGPSPDLVGLWHFDGDTLDSSGKGLDGALSLSGASFVVDGFGQALNVDGTGWVQIPDSSLLEPSEITVEAWVKKQGSPGGAKYIVSKYLPNKYGSYSSYGLYTGGSGGIQFYIGYTSWVIFSPAVSPSTIWDGNWHHVAGTFDGSEVKLYIDRVQVDGATSTIQDIYYFGTGNLYIGAYTDSSYLAFSGTIDEVRIWKVALTAGQLGDITPPEITMNGTSPVTIEPGSIYTDAGATAMDNIDGDITTSIVTVNSVNTAVPDIYTVTYNVTDSSGNAAETVTRTVNVFYTWAGFFNPVDNLPTVNAAKAGSAIPVKFSLSGYQGLDIFATGYPKSEEISCDSTNSVDGIEQTVTAGVSSLNYDTTADQYIYVWKTEKAWAGTCRQLVVKLIDNTYRRANFTFIKK